MGDEDGSQELPQRSRGAARGGSDRAAPSVSPVLSEELRQRIQAAVKAERAEAAAIERPTATRRSGRETLSAPADSGAAGPAGNGIAGARKHERAARPERLGNPEALAKPDEQRERPAKNGTGVTPQPAAKRPASHKPAAPGHGRIPARGLTSLSGHPEESARKKPHDGRLIRVGLVVLALALVAIGSLVTSASLHFAGSSSGNRGPTAAALQRQEALTRRQAASWVAQQVSRGDVVSCDQAMCAALRTDGFPAGKLLMLGPTSPPPVTSSVVVVTQVVRDEFGSSIGSAWAPAVLASIGSGAAEVTIRVIAPHGAVTYQAQLNSGLADRTQNGTVLEGNPQITFSGSAKANLAAGRVDPRLLLALANLASAEPIDIVRFGNVGPGASAGLLLRYADLAVNDQAANMDSPAYLRTIKADLSTADIQIRPASSQTVAVPGGQPVFRVEFSAPSPLGSASS